MEEEAALKRMHNNCGGARSQFLPLWLKKSVQPLLSGRMLSVASKEYLLRDFPDGPVVKNPPCNAGDAGSIPG